MKASLVNREGCLAPVSATLVSILQEVKSFFGQDLLYYGVSTSLNKIRPNTVLSTSPRRRDEYAFFRMGTSRLCWLLYSHCSAIAMCKYQTGTPVWSSSDHDYMLSRQLSSFIQIWKVLGIPQSGRLYKKIESHARPWDINTIKSRCRRSDDLVFNFKCLSSRIWPRASWVVTADECWDIRGNEYDMHILQLQRCGPTTLLANLSFPSDALSLHFCHWSAFCLGRRFRLRWKLSNEVQ